MHVSEAIRARRSIRRYKPDAPVTDAQVDLLLEAAMMAPSAKNKRPWEFVVVRDRAKLTAMADTHPYAEMLRTAPLAIVILALPGVQVGMEPCFPHDCGAAAENILLQAVGLGLGTCWCGVHPYEDRIAALRGVLDLDDPDRLPICFIAVGVPDEAPAARGRFERGKIKFI